MNEKMDILLHLLESGKPCGFQDLVKKTGYKNKVSLKQAVHTLRLKGYTIKPNRINCTYTMELKDFAGFWPCMIPKKDWPVCRGIGCRHKNKCEATIDVF